MLTYPYATPPLSGLLSFGWGGLRRDGVSLLGQLVVLSLLTSLPQTYARAQTTRVIDFDDPMQFAPGQTITNLAGVSFTGAPQVFKPTVSTTSPPYALRAGKPCNDHECSNGAYMLHMEFIEAVSAVSVRAGTDESLYYLSDGTLLCFFEGGGDCEVFARLVGYNANETAIADSRDVLIASTSRGKSLTTELSIGDVGGRIKSVTLFTGLGTFVSHDPPSNPTRAQIDHLVFTIAAGKVATVVPDKPSVTITSPKQDEYIDLPYWTYSSRFSGVSLSGRVLAPGRLFAFCTHANSELLPPPPSACSEAGSVRPDGTFGPILVPGTVLQGGTNTLAAYAYDLSGQLATAVVVVTLPSPELDFEISGMEITQGIQRVEIPLNTREPQTYDGVKLIKGKKTVVRVFANRVGAGPAQNIQASLHVLMPNGQGGEIELANLPPDNGSRDLSVGGPSVPLAERGDPDGAYVFTLPVFLWSQMIAPTPETMTFRAELNPSHYSGECSNCYVNNSFTVKDVPFGKSLTLYIHPVEITWTDATGTKVRPNANPAAVFAPTQRVSPLADWNGLVVLPYDAEIDVTGLMNRSPLIPSDSLSMLIVDFIEAFENFNPAGGPPHYRLGIVNTRGRDVGVEIPMFFGFPYARVVPIAVVDDYKRPLTNVAHEFYHELSYYHAGTGCRPSFPDIPWPPDQRGYIQGIGLDPRTGSGPKPGTYRVIAPHTGPLVDVYDFMSYCVDRTNPDSNAWISVPNWQAFGYQFPNGLIPDLGQQPIAAIPTPAASKRTIRVVAQMSDSGKAAILRIERGTGEQGVAIASPSAHHLIVRSESGSELVNVPITAFRGHIHGGRAGSTFYMFSAEVPAEGAYAVELVRDGVVIDRRTRSPHLPIVSIIEPRSGMRIPSSGTTLVRWRASDADGDVLRTRVEYSTDDGQTFRPLTLDVTAGEIRLSNRLFRASRQARVRVTVNDGFNEAGAVSGRFRADGTPPLTLITDPASLAVVRSEGSLTLTGQGVDEAGNVIPSGRLLWYERGRLLGRGNQITLSALRAGKHTVRLVAMDASGRGGSSTIDYAVTPVRPVFLKLSIPDTLSRSATQLRIQVSSNVPAVLEVQDRRYVVGRPPRRISIPVPPGIEPLSLDFRLESHVDTTSVQRVVIRR